MSPFSCCRLQAFYAHNPKAPHESLYISQAAPDELDASAMTRRSNRPPAFAFLFERVQGLGIRVLDHRETGWQKVLASFLYLEPRKEEMFMFLNTIPGRQQFSGWSLVMQVMKVKGPGWIWFEGPGP